MVVKCAYDTARKGISCQFWYLLWTIQISANFAKFSHKIACIDILDCNIYAVWFLKHESCSVQSSASQLTSQSATLLLYFCRLVAVLGRFCCHHRQSRALATSSTCTAAGRHWCLLVCLHFCSLVDNVAPAHICLFGHHHLFNIWFCKPNLTQIDGINGASPDEYLGGRPAGWPDDSCTRRNRVVIVVTASFGSSNIRWTRVDLFVCLPAASVDSNARTRASEWSAWDPCYVQAKYRVHTINNHDN